MTNPIRTVLRLLLHYVVLCFGCLLAFPSILFAVVLSAGLALLLLPWLIVEALKIEVFQLPALLGGLVYFCVLWLTWRFQTTIIATAKLSALSVALAFFVFAISAELKWRSTMNADAVRYGLGCITVPNFIALRFQEASPALHSGEKLF